MNIRYLKTFPLSLTLFLLSLAVGCGGAGKSVGQFTEIQQPLYRWNSLAFLQNNEIAVRNLGSPINTNKDEYGPQFGPGGKVFYLSRGGNGQFDIYYSRVGSFTSPDFGLPPERLSPPDRRIGSITYAGNGSRVVFVACHLADGKGSCDLYEIEGYGTADAASVNIDRVNTPSWESSPMLSYDGTQLFFTTLSAGNALAAGVRENEHSNIMVSRLDDEGEWGLPAVAERVNSGTNEDTPFLVRGDSALYFCSDRPGGYGGLDIYVSFREKDGGWGTPYNLGYPINTEADERSFIVTPDGKGMYFASNRKGDSTAGGYDIYVAEFKDR